MESIKNFGIQRFWMEILKFGGPRRQSAASDFIFKGSFVLDFEDESFSVSGLWKQWVGFFSFWTLKSTGFSVLNFRDNRMTGGVCSFPERNFESKILKVHNFLDKYFFVDLSTASSSATEIDFLSSFSTDASAGVDALIGAEAKARADTRVEEDFLDENFEDLQVPEYFLNANLNSYLLELNQLEQCSNH
ncbi:unnamed protein product [Rhizophagus irregularis]|nr:unnamed protein product [Rhizophagus irregularis]